MRRALAAARRSDAGVSVVELLVGMVISSLLLAAVSAFVVAGVRTTDGANQRNGATGQLRTATDRMTQQLRTADSYDGNTPAIIVAEAQRIGFYARLNTLDLGATNAGSQTQVPSVVWLWTQPASDGLTLCQQVYRGAVSGSSFSFPAGAQSATATRSCQVVARGLSASAPRALFTYLRRSDTTLRTDGSTVSSVAASSAGTVAAASIGTVDSVELWLTSGLRTSGSSANPSTVARVTLVNLTSRSN